MTERLYYTDSYLREFTARITSQTQCEAGVKITLDRTAFYPTSGGQPHDLGQIGEARIVEVLESEGGIEHFLDSDCPEQDEVRCKIDWKRRFDHMQQHSGQHVLSQAFLQILKADTESFHLGDRSCTIDLSVGSLERDTLYEVEDLANQTVFENRPVSVTFVNSADQENLPVRKRSARVGALRVIEIEGFDLSPCGGTHCRFTGEIGLIKIRRWERVRQKARVEFFCGSRALRDYRFKNRELYCLSNLYSSSDEEVVSIAEKHLLTQKSQRKEIERLNEQLLKLEAQALESTAELVKGIRIISSEFEGKDLNQLNRLATLLLTDQESRVILLASKESRAFVLLARSRDLEELDLRGIIKEVSPLIGGGGGGTPDRVQGAGTKVEDIAEAVSAARQAVLKELE